MAREIAWRDVLTLLRYRNRELFLDNALGLTFAPSLISNVLFSLLLPSSGYCAAVQVQPEGSPPLIGQIYSSNAKGAAQLAFLAPRDHIAPEPLVDLLSFLSQQAGDKGGFQIRAEVERDSTLEDGFREAGFHAYAEQHVWRMPDSLAAHKEVPQWEPVSPRDELNVEGFCRQIVPRNVQRVEPPSASRGGQGLLFRENGQLLGFASSHGGPKGVLIDLVTDPSLSDLERHIQAICEKMSLYRRQNFYLRVRTYQKRIATALERMEAEQGPAQLAMVKFLAIHYRAKQSYPRAAFDTQPDITTPFVKSKARQTYYEQ